MAVQATACLWLILLALTPCVALPTSAIMGPFEVKVKQVGSCPKAPASARNMSFSTRLTKVSRTRIMYSSNLTLPHTIDDTTSAMIVADVMGNGGWRDNFFKIAYKQTCVDAKRYFPKFFKDMMRAINHTDCPIPKGTVRIVNFPFDIKPSFGVFPYGQYRVSTLFYDHSGRMFGCYQMYADIVPARQ